MPDNQQLFVGRQPELERFKSVLADPAGQAVLVVGQAGMGKTLLINEMADLARKRPDLKCGAVRYEVTPTDSLEGLMALMIDHAYDAAQVSPPKLSGTKDQWRALFKACEMIPVAGKAAASIGELAMSLKRDPTKNSRDQLLDRLEYISGKMPDTARAVFIVDPEKYMPAEADQTWAPVLRRLPPRIKFIFAQRPDDALAKSPIIDALANLVRIPDADLDVLDEQSVDELIHLRAGEFPQSERDVRKALARYQGHPYATQGALNLIIDGRPIDDLPPDPTGIAQAQWTQICDKHKSDAVKLFQAYAVLEVPVPDDVVEHVAQLAPEQRKSLTANAFLGALLRAEPQGRRIYHALLRDHILSQMSDAESKSYHARAVEIYRRRLNVGAKPDPLGAVRLPEHVLQTDGPQAFVRAFINECGRKLITIGLLDEFIALSERALRVVAPNSQDAAALSGNLALIYQRRGDLEQAEEMLRKALDGYEPLGDRAGVARQYGNLGSVYLTRGRLDQAEEMQRKALQIHERMGNQEGMATSYGNLGLIYETRGDLDRAEEMHKKSLEIYEPLGNQEGIANDYGNLGLMYQRRGELDHAEEMLRKALEIHERMGNQEGIAADYGNLGSIMEQRGEIPTARDYGTKARDLYQKIGIPHMVKKLNDFLAALPPDTPPAPPDPIP